MSADVQSADRAFCRTVLPQVSRTFALGIRLLPPSLSWTVSIAYLICRIADTIEDHSALTVSARRALLAELESALADPLHRLTDLAEVAWPPAERTLIRSTERVLREFSRLPVAERAVIARWAGEMIRGMSESLSATGRDTAAPFETLSDLHRYCYYVAGTVGHMLTDLFQIHSRGIDAPRHARLDALATEFGLGLQLTNITRDLADDLRDGRNFVPVEIWRRAGLTPATLFSVGREAASWQVGEPLVAEASRNLSQALSYCCALPWSEVRMRFFCFTSLIFAARTLTLIERQRGAFVAGHRIKMSRANVYGLLAITFFITPFNPMMRLVFRGVARQRPAPGAQPPALH